MAETDDREDHTEQPTARRLEQAAEKGDIPRSMELSTWFVLGAGTLALMIAGGSSAQTLALSLRGMLGNAHAIPADGASLMRLGQSAVLTTLGALAVPLLLLFFAGILGNLIQNPPRITTEQIGFKLQRISPIAASSASSARKPSSSSSRGSPSWASSAPRSSWRCGRSASGSNRSSCSTCGAAALHPGRGDEAPRHGARDLRLRGRGRRALPAHDLVQASDDDPARAEGRVQGDRGQSRGEGEACASCAPRPRAGA